MQFGRVYCESSHKMVTLVPLCPMLTCATNSINNERFCITYCYVHSSFLVVLKLTVFEQISLSVDDFRNVFQFIFDELETIIKVQDK